MTENTLSFTIRFVLFQSQTNNKNILGALPSKQNLFPWDIFS